MEIGDLFSTLKISSAALNAYQGQLSVTAENIANATTTRTEGGGAYQRKMLIKTASETPAPFAGLLAKARTQLRTSRGNHISQSSRGLVQSGNKAPGIEAEVEENPQFRRVYEPDHPDADAEGFVEYPDINVVWEMMELITASRAYEANITVMNAAKNLAQRAMEI